MKKSGWLALGLVLMGCTQHIPFSTEPAILRGTWQARLQKSCQLAIGSVSWNPQNTGGLVFADQHVLLWDSRNDTTRTLETKLQPIRLVWTQDGTQVVAVYPNKGRYDQTLLKRYDPTTASTKNTLELEGSEIAAYTNWWISPDGRFVAAATADGDLQWWDAQTGRSLHNVVATSSSIAPNHSPPPPPIPDWTVGKIVWNANGSRMAVLGKRKGVAEIQVLDTANATVLRTLVGTQDSWDDLRLNDDGTTLSLVYSPVSAPENWIIKDIVIFSGQTQTEKTFSRSSATGQARFSQNGRMLWFLALDNFGTFALRTIDLETGISTSLDTPSFTSYWGTPKILPSSNAKTLFVQNSTCSVGIYDLASKNKTANLILDTSFDVTGTLELSATLRDSSSYKVAGTANLGVLGSFQVSGQGALGTWANAVFTTKTDMAQEIGFDLTIKNNTQTAHLTTSENTKSITTVNYTSQGQFTENNRTSSVTLALSKAIP